MVLKATFNNILVKSWWSILLVEETAVHWENHRPAATLWHNVVLSTPHLISTDFIGSYPTIVQSRPRRPPNRILRCHNSCYSVHKKIIIYQIINLHQRKYMCGRYFFILAVCGHDHVKNIWIDVNEVNKC